MNLPSADKEHPFHVTIGIPTYNRADLYLRMALESALDQTYPHLEVVVSDNGSTDGTQAYVTGIKDDRIRYFRHEAVLTPNGNFNFCLDQARGDYFILLHDDDFIDPDFVSECIKVVQSHPGVGVIRTGTRIVDADGHILRNAPGSQAAGSAADLFARWFEKRTAFYFCSSMFATKLLREAGGLHSRHNVLEDCTAILDLASMTGHVEIPLVKANFREHANYAQYGRKLRLWVEDFLWLYDRIMERLPEANMEMKEAGRRFFAALSYRRARTIESRWGRWQAYLYVWRQMGRAYPPPAISRRWRRGKK